MAWLVQPDGTCRLTVTPCIVLMPVFVMVADAGVCTPEVSVVSACCPGAVPVTCRPAVGRADLPSRISTWWPCGNMVTVWLAAS